MLSDGSDMGHLIDHKGCLWYLLCFQRDCRSPDDMQVFFKLKLEILYCCL